MVIKWLLTLLTRPFIGCAEFNGQNRTFFSYMFCFVLQPPNIKLEKLCPLNDLCIG